jgi:hypothetical protein
MHRGFFNFQADSVFCFEIFLYFTRNIKTMEKPNLSDSAVFYLSEARKWAKFIAIICFIGMGIMVISGLVMGLVFDSLTSAAGQSALPFSGSVFMIMYLAMAAIYFFPVYYLFRFSEAMGNALASGSEEIMTTAFGYLKSHYKFIGILLIVSMALAVLGIIGAVLAGIFGLFNAHPESTYF